MIHSRMTSMMNARGASVLSEPAKACERETLKPPFRSADLTSAGGSQRVGKEKEEEEEVRDDSDGGRDAVKDAAELSGRKVER